MHIDFGFMLCNSPGSVGFELAPFKLPQEYVDILGGVYSEKFEMFKSLLLQAFLALRKRSQSVIELVEIMEKDSTLPCFTGVTPKSHIVVNANLPEPPINLTPIPKSSSMESFTPYLVTNSLRERFHLEMTEAQVAEFIDKIVESSCNNTFTKLYDAFQYYSNGIL